MKHLELERQGASHAWHAQGNAPDMHPGTMLPPFRPQVAVDKGRSAVVKVLMPLEYPEPAVSGKLQLVNGSRRQPSKAPQHCISVEAVWRARRWRCLAAPQRLPSAFPSGKALLTCLQASSPGLCPCSRLQSWVLSPHIRGGWRPRQHQQPVLHLFGRASPGGSGELEGVGAAWLSAAVLGCACRCMHTECSLPTELPYDRYLCVPPLHAQMPVHTVSLTVSLKLHPLGCSAQVPCGHRSLCAACAKLAMKTAAASGKNGGKAVCPICRAAVMSLLRVFDA